MTPRRNSRRAAVPLAALLAALALAACAGRSGIPAGAVPTAAAASPSARADDAEPLAPGIVPLTLEQERDAE